MNCHSAVQPLTSATFHMSMSNRVPVTGDADAPAMNVAAASLALRRMWSMASTLVAVSGHVFFDSHHTVTAATAIMPATAPTISDSVVTAARAAMPAAMSCRVRVSLSDFFDFVTPRLLGAFASLPFKEQWVGFGFKCGAPLCFSFGT